MCYTKNNKHSKILSPKLDVVFKLFFGDKRNIDILIDFLQSIVDLPDEEFESISISDPHLKRERLNDKLGIVDVNVTTVTGKIIHIEMQVQHTEDMPERLMYYNSKLFVSQIKEGESYGNLQKTITILITDFTMIKNSSSYHHTFRYLDLNTSIELSDLMEIHTLELTKIPMESDQTKKYNWLRFLNAKREEEFEMLAKKDDTLKKAYIKLKRLSDDEQAQFESLAREIALMDEQVRLQSAIKKGKLEGKIEGKQEIIREMLLQQLDETLIKNIAKVSDEEINVIKQSLT